MNDQNESPFGNPKFLVSIIVVFIFLWGWQFFISKKYPTPPAVQSNAVSSVESKTQVLEKQPEVATAKTDAIKEANETDKNYEVKSFDYEDDQVKWAISSAGMGFSHFELKKYFDTNNKAVVFTSEDSLFSVLSGNKKINFEVKKINEFEFVGTASINGITITRKLKYNKENTSFQSLIDFQPGLSDISIVLSDKKRTPKSSSFLMPSFEKQDFLFREGDKIKTENISSLEEPISKNANQVSLASINSQYFSEALIDKSDVLPNIHMIVDGAKAILNVNYELKNTQIKKLEQIFFLGPKSTDNMKSIDPLLPEVMDYGMFGFISKPLLVLMRFLHQLLGNWGLAIIALTLVVRLVMLPFNILSFRSSRAMQKIQPHLKAIREKYKNDPLQVNRETMALMKEHKANPLSGCLPMLIQIPIFFALWRTIGSSIEIYQQPFFGWITDLSAHDHFFVLPVLMGVTMFFQQKLTPTTMDPAQQKILNFMPILFALFMLSLPSGLTLYNFVSALFGVVQQYFLLKDKSASKAT